MMNLNRKTLYYRHRLSHQQIDMLLGENNASNFADDKMRILQNIKKIITVTNLFRKELIHFIPTKSQIQLLNLHVHYSWHIIYIYQFN